MANLAQPQVVINYISQRKKIIVNRNNQPSQLIIQTDYYLNEIYNFQIVNAINQIVELDSNTTYQLYGTYIDAKKQVHILFYTLGVTPTDNTLSFLVNTYTSEYLAYVKNNRTPIDISIVAKQNVGGSTRSYMVLRDSALANPRGYVEGQAPTDIVYQNVFNADVPVTGSFGAGTNLDLAQDFEGQDVGSFAFGDTLTTSNANQFVVGYNNTPDATKAFIIANNGNIFTVDYEGNVEANSISASAISATSLTVNGIPVATEGTIATELAATSAWAENTFAKPIDIPTKVSELENDVPYLSAHQSLDDYATKEWVEGKNYLTGVNLEPYATKDELNTKANSADVYTKTSADQTFATKTDLTLSTALLGQQISQLALEVPTKVTDLTDAGNYALKSEIPVTTGFATKEEVAAVDNKFNGYATTETVNGIDARLTAVENAGYITDSALEPYAKTSAVAETYATKNEISDFITEDALTGLATKQEATYTGTGAVSVENNVISLTGELGKTYYADETTLQLDDSTNTFSIKSLEGKIEAGNANIDIQFVDGVAYISAATGGGGGGTDKIYSAGTGLSSTNVTASNTQFFVDQDWLSTFVENATGDVGKTYTGASGIVVDNTNNVIGVSAQYLTQDSLTDYATKEYVTGQVSGKASQTDLETLSTQVQGIPVVEKVSDLQQDIPYLSAITSADIPTSYVQKDDLSSYAELSTVEAIDSRVSAIEASGLITAGEVDTKIGTATTDMATQTWVENQHYITSAEAPSTVYFAGDGLKLEDSTFSLTATVSDIEGYDTLALKSELEDLSAAIPTSYVQPSAIAEMATTGYVQEQVSGKANSADVYAKTDTYSQNEVDTLISEASTAILTSVPSTVYEAGFGLELQNSNKFVLTAAISDLEGYSDVNSAIGAKANSTDLEYVSGVVDTKAAASALNDYALTSNVYTKSQVYTKEQTNSAINTATSGKADQSTVEGLSTALSAAITGVVDSLSSKANVDDVYNKTEVYTKTEADNKFLTEHQSLSAYYNKEEVNAISSALSTTVSEANYQNATEVSAIVEDMSGAIVNGYATQDWVTNTALADNATQTWVNTQISGKATKDEVSTLCGALSGAIDTKANSADVYAKNEVYTKDETTGAINTATSGKADKTTVESLSTNLSGAVDYVSGVASTNTTNIGLIDGRVQTIESDYVKSADLTATSTYINTVSTALNNSITGNAQDIGTLCTKFNDYDTSTQVTEKVNAASAYAYNQANSLVGSTSATLTTSIKAVDDKFANYYDKDAVDGKFTATSTYINATSTALNNDLTGKISYVSGVVDTFDSRIETVSGNLDTLCGRVDVIEGDYVTSSVLTAYVNNQYVAVSQLANDVGYITAGDFPAGTVYLAGTGLNLSNATFSVNEEWLSGKIAAQGGSSYSAGTGIDITNNVISISASWLNAQIAAQIPTAGVGLVKNGNEFSLSAAGAGENKVLSSANGTIVWADNVAGGGGGKTYTGASGVTVDNDNDKISIDKTWLDQNYSPTVTNKKNMLVDAETKDSTFELPYNANYDIFVNQIASVNSAITINQVSGFTGDNGQVASFEHWIKSSGDLTGFVGNGVELVNVPATGLDSSKTQVFTRRIVKNNNVVSQYAVWEYQFNNAAVPPADKIIAVTPQDFTFNIRSNTSSDIDYEFTGQNQQSVGFTYSATLPEGISFSNGTFSNTGSQLVGNSTATIPVTISALNAQNQVLEKVVYCNLTLTGFELVEVPNQELEFAYNTNATSGVAYTYYGNQAGTVEVQLTGSYSLPDGVSFANNQFTCVGANLTGNTTRTLTAYISGADVEPITTEFDLTISDVPIIASNQTFDFDFREQNQTSALTYNHLGSAQVNVANVGLPNGISYANGYFTATSAANVSNGTTVATTTISADDADTATINTTFNLIGHVTETLTAPASSMTFDFANSDTVSGEYTFTYTGNFATLTATVTGLPTGITASQVVVDGTSGTITFTGTKADLENETYNISVVIKTIDAVDQTASVAITAENISSIPQKEYLIWDMDFSNGLVEPKSNLTGTNTASDLFAIQEDSTMGNYLHCTKTTQDDNKYVCWNGSKNYFNSIFSNPTSNPITVSFWMYFTTPIKDPNGMFTTRSYDNKTGILISMNDANGAQNLSTNIYAILRNNSNGNAVVGITNKTGQQYANQWIQIVFVRDSTNGRMYINGTQIGSNTNMNSFNIAADIDIYIGGGWTGWQGLFASFDVTKYKIWNKALTVEQIQTLYTNKQ